jgi:hypothetical protein
MMFFWHFPYNKEIKKYQILNSNEKYKEKMFIKKLIQREFQEVKIFMGIERDELSVFERLFIKIQKLLKLLLGICENNVFCCHSLVVAKEIIRLLIPKRRRRFLLKIASKTALFESKPNSAKLVRSCS